jgi:hypothetical protein
MFKRFVSVLFVSVVLFLTGCTDEQPERISYDSDLAVEYYFDPSCQADPQLIDLAGEGFTLWQDFGVEVVEVSGSAPGAVAVCLRDPSPDFAGRTTSTDEGWRIQIAHSRNGEPWRNYVQVAAHELGHVLLDNFRHLPREDTGIMAWTVGNQTDYWSDADIAFILAVLDNS